jgi:hypothetical protein
MSCKTFTIDKNQVFSTFDPRLLTLDLDFWPSTSTLDLWPSTYDPRPSTLDHYPNSIITRDVFFNAVITRDAFFPKITLAVFLELRFKLRVSLRMKMGAIIRLVCFIKTKNPEIQYKISLSVGYEYNWCIVFFCVFQTKHLCVFQRCYISQGHMEEVISRWPQNDISSKLYSVRLGTGLGLELVSGPYARFFHQVAVGLYAEKVPNIQRIINMTF